MIIKERISPKLPVHKETVLVGMSGIRHRQANDFKQDANEAMTTKTYPMNDEDDDDNVVYSSSGLILLLVAFVKIDESL